ncbi:MAG TPA: sugar phosphate isomerase/epimerase [Fermentimonas caenicola]|jgi:sugar phosphate isomerase/epimerase|uniref:Xylose isomerase-like TIM barrel domain-containing protein n=1 Tax=Fermentimonas caenicola TaxID=1562970 RepID=A0A098C0A9_9BACT|nr:sugar phosphate isomerase/epimerase family protein [Lascolabacillus massiliensis]MBP6175104.1 sugar phosphate isomerase/epimerase [Fermentimonas sp.]MCK9501403.1 sugar phosphate isomerase/epimerase [Lascolabacillus sp.]MDI9625196.1 sugar phosphate isomerase/epimerase family protein [Bacteroidota bacterium]TAH60050.1 MAG: sugar phosphate isomerase/epimerase [Fermentimonas caenicola]HBT86756.1 sugar phosphate isomerase/epimerase [Porphyromonadaceae bacterium]
MKKHSTYLSALFLSCLFIFTACNQGQKQEAVVENKKDIYIQLYSVRDDIKADYTGTIAAVAEMGYTGVEAAGYNDGKFYDMSPADFKKSIEDAGMTVLSSHAGRPLADPAADTNWEETWAWWDTAIQAHKEAGMKYLVVAWIPTPKTLVDLQAYCDYFNQIGEKCNAAGIRFGYHNHNFEFTEIEGEMMYDYMINNTDPDKVFYQMDVYWVGQGGQDPVAYMNKYPGRFEILHIKDELEIGKSGQVDFEAIYNNAEVAGAKYMVVEVERYTGTPLDGVKESYDYLNNAEFVKASYSK